MAEAAVETMAEAAVETVAEAVVETAAETACFRSHGRIGRVYFRL